MFYIHLQVTDVNGEISIITMYRVPNFYRSCVDGSVLEPTSRQNTFTSV